MISLHPLGAEHAADCRAVFGLDRAAPLSQTLIAAAIAVGRMPGEPARLIKPTRSRGWFDNLFRQRRPTPLADPRLEVLRAISASLMKRPSGIPVHLITVADRTGWTPHDLHRLFPATSMGFPA